MARPESTTLACCDQPESEEGAMAPKRGRNPRGKVRMEKRAPPPSTRGPDSVLSIRGGVPVASSRPPRLGGPRCTNGTALGGRGATTHSLATRGCPAEQRQQHDGHKGGHPGLQWGRCHDIILRHVVRWDPRGAQGGVDEVSRPRADSECAHRKCARVARVFEL